MKFRKPRRHSLTASKQRRHWTTEEDLAITDLVSQYSDCKWTEISERLASEFGLEDRSGKQCRERWHNHLNPSLNKQEWSVSEQLLLFTKHQELGNSWAQITSFLPGRSENALKNQFYSMLRKQYRKWKGSDPSRSQLKKYDSVLTAQIVGCLNKKLKHKAVRTAEAPAEFKGIDDLDPITLPPEEVFTLAEDPEFASAFSLFDM